MSTSGLAGQYRVDNISDDPHGDGDTALNDQGQIAWVKKLPQWEIFFYSQGTISRITNNTFTDQLPSINKAGQIVWMGEPVPLPQGVNYEIFFYDGNEIFQMTSNIIHDTNPGINDNGRLVWQTIERYNPYTYIYLFDGQDTIQLVNVPYYQQMPRINNSGQVAWNGDDGQDDEIYFYDGEVQQLTGNDYDDYMGSFNDEGKIVWTGEDDTDTEIFLYENGTIRQITDNTYDDYAPILNDRGQIAWMADLIDSDLTSTEIFFFDGSNMVQVTHNTYYDSIISINNNGYIAFSSLLDNTDWNSREVIVYDGTGFIQLTDNDYAELYITTINDLNQIAWTGFSTKYTDRYGWPTTDIFLATPITPIEVSIDIKPGSDPNCFNSNGSGVIPVAILGSSEFDTTVIDPATILLESLAVRAKGKGDKFNAGFEDVNNDGFTDLVVQIKDEDGVFEVGSISATLTGNLFPEYDALPIEGTDSICITQ
jgi:hypothetical protein